MNIKNYDVAVLIPCYNEETTVAKVVRDFRAALPDSRIIVCDNNSTDRTAAVARDAGAVVVSESLRGKGNAVRRLFSDVDADIYVLVDGDDTYDAPSALALIAHLLREGLDMVNAERHTNKEAAYRKGHRMGNTLLTALISAIFGWRFKDILSGYRVFSRRFVKSFPALSTGFEIETELTVHALELRMPVAELRTPYKERPDGSSSKLRTFHDGIKILKTIAILVKEERPLRFFSAIALLLVTTSVILGIPVIKTYIEIGLVPRFPTAILATGLMILSFLSFTSGLVLESVTLSRREMKRMHYLGIKSIFSLGHK